MKKFMVMALSMLTGYVIQAQDRPAPPSMDERLKRTMDIIDPKQKEAMDKR